MTIESLIPALCDGCLSFHRKDDKLKLVVPCCVVVRTTPMTSGNFHWTLEDVSKSIVCIMSSPCQAGSTQMLNDWYDREIDAINEPYRPIPSVAISENELSAV
ncbi:hypothetical protein LOK49_Contig143G00003 [Camellia lanceoleosa]|nr:hypothetical protein LOK49_Contig143G00003 [Camellia lanceoleosa]